MSLYERVAEYGPVSATLAKLVRPAIQAKKDHVFVWGDWSAIEARTNPWLSKMRSAEEAVLLPYERGEDLYILNAMDIYNVSEIVRGTPEGDKMRGGGKIAVLSLGFLGGAGALRAMARKQGIRMSEDEAQMIVDGWRGRNMWARAFGNAAWEAIVAVIEQPGLMLPVGRLHYSYDKNMMCGTLLCWLPSGRPLAYPWIRMGVQEKYDEEVFAVSYRHNSGRAFMWAGKAIQGPTQACAADILRGSLDTLDHMYMGGDEAAKVVAHTHDEIILEVPEALADRATTLLEQVMLQRLPWMDDKLPLAVEIESAFFYHK